MLSLSLPNTSMQDLLRRDSSTQVDSNEYISLFQSEVGIQAEMPEKELHSSVGKSLFLAYQYYSICHDKVLEMQYIQIFRFQTVCNEYGNQLKKFFAMIFPLPVVIYF